MSFAVLTARRLRGYLTWSAGIGVFLVLGLPIAVWAGAEKVTITGPISQSGIPGSPAHDYPFFATNHDLATRGYIEAEFFIQGTANRYNTPPQTTGTIADSDHPYKTRVMVRRPADAKRFNGTVLVEWDNVTNGFDAENIWFFSWEHILRAGYVWVGVSAQQVGVTALKNFSTTRYGTLDVNQGGTITGDALSFDIFSQVGQAIKTPASVDLLGGLKPRNVIAVGESQSAQRLSTYVNSINPMAGVYDGFMLLSSLNQKIRTDLPVPVWKVNAEHDVWFGEANVRQPDAPMFHTWEVTGTSHVDHHLRQSREPLELRDIGKSGEAAFAPTCDVPTIGTRVPMQYVLSSVFDLLARWVEKRVPPPAAPPITLSTIGKPNVIARDKAGLALGGIRLAEVAVPTGLNVGTNSGPGACDRWGYFKPFDISTLNKMYATHQDYVSAVERVTNENLKAGFILRVDAEHTIRDAKNSAIGRLDSIEAERERPLADFDRAP